MPEPPAARSAAAGHLWSSVSSGEYPMPRPRFVILGNAASRRVTLFQQALASHSLPPARVIDWHQLLTAQQLPELVASPGTIVRIESPGECFDVERELLLRGVEPAAAEGSLQLEVGPLRQLQEDRGRILPSRQWFLGFQQVLRELTAIHQAASSCQGAEAASPFQWMNPPDQIAVQFDKPACQQRLLDAGIPVPPVLPAEQQSPCHAEELLQAVDQAGWNRVFIKPAHGSSASGAMALHRQQPDSTTPLVAITSIEPVRAADGLRLYNSLKIRRLTDELLIREILDVLCSQRVQVEQWLPKAALQPGTVFDLRVLVTAGDPGHLVVRQSRSPLTNLHLGNRRGCPQQLIERFSPARVDQWLDTCRRTLACFPGSLYAGIDLLVTPGGRHHAVLEVNAFGDLLPGIVSSEGHSPAEAAVNALLRPCR